MDRPTYQPQSFSRVAFQTGRALSSFVAIAATKVHRPHQVRNMLIAAGVLLATTLLTTGALQIAALTVAALLGGISLVQVYSSEKVAILATNPEHRRQLGRAILIERLNSVRISQGLDTFLAIGTLRPLEASALDWEKVEHMLAVKGWSKDHPERMRIEDAAFDTMLNVLALTLGSPVAEGVDSEEIGEKLIEQKAKLNELSRSMEIDADPGVTYPRASQVPTPEYGDLKEFLISQAPDQE